VLLTARCKYWTQKKSPKIAIWAPSHNFVGRYLRNYGTYRQSEKNLLSSNISSTCPHNMVNFGPLAAEIVSLVWGTPGNFNGFSVLAALLHGTLVVGVSQTAAFNRGRHLHSAGRPSRWALAHISSLWLYCALQFICLRFSFLGLFCVIFYLCTMYAFVVLNLFLVYSVLCQEIGWEERL